MFLCFCRALLLCTVCVLFCFPQFTCLLRALLLFSHTSFPLLLFLLLLSLSFSLSPVFLSPGFRSPSLSLLFSHSFFSPLFLSVDSPLNFLSTTSMNWPPLQPTRLPFRANFSRWLTRMTRSTADCRTLSLRRWHCTVSATLPSVRSFSVSLSRLPVSFTRSLSVRILISVSEDLALSLDLGL